MRDQRALSLPHSNSGVAIETKQSPKRDKVRSATETTNSRDAMSATRTFFGSLGFALLAIHASISAYAQKCSPREATWTTNGPVYAIATTPSTTYIGGQFSYIGPTTGHGAPLDGTTGAINGTFPKVNGSVFSCVPDGSGGWYIGGTFTEVEGVPRNSIAHILAGGYLDNAWNPDARGSAQYNPNDFLYNCTYVTALAVSGNVVYAGGLFTHIGGQPRNNIAALDATTGLATDWNPDAKGVADNYTSMVLGLTVSGNMVYACGRFSMIGGQVRSGIAALDAVTGMATPWAPKIDGYVQTIAVLNDVVYTGGCFNAVGNKARRSIAAIDASTGEATDWDPVLDGSYLFVSSLAISGNLVYVAGGFTNVGGQPRNQLAALDATTALPTDWRPDPSWPGSIGYGPSTNISCLAVSGNVVYVGGAFTSIGGKTRRHIAALDATTGSATDWVADAMQDVYALAVWHNVVYAGGGFTSIGGLARNNIAALDANTGAGTSWNPNSCGWPNSPFVGQIYALAVSGNIVYAGGRFSSIGGADRAGIAALDVATGLAVDWNTQLGGSLDSWLVTDSAVYAGGSLDLSGNHQQFCVASLIGSPAQSMLWNTSAEVSVASPEVHALAASGETIYAGGWFDNIGGQVRANIAALDRVTGQAIAWAPNANNEVTALVAKGNTVYAAGFFNSIGGQTRQGVAALDAATGLASAWAPEPHGNGRGAVVHNLALGDGVLYVAGDFSQIGGQSRRSLAAIDVNNGSATEWNPNPEPLASDYFVPIQCIAVSGHTVYVGGAFNRIGGKQRAYFAQFDPIYTCDIDGDGTTGAVDLQIVINRVLGLVTEGNADVNNDNNTDAADVQLVINAALGVE